ncbi:MAG: peptidase [Cyanobacteria bacterium RYN_339]|nr:peptidase [Cyanobacteria bacterium RYN_339]
MGDAGPREGAEAMADGAGDVPARLPLLPLRGSVAFPGLMIPLVVNRPGSIEMVERAAAGDGWLGLVAVRDPDVSEPGAGDIFRTGVAGRIQRVWRTQEGSLQALVQGVERVRLGSAVAENEAGCLEAGVDVWPDASMEGAEERALLHRIMATFHELARVSPHLPPELVGALVSADGSPELIYMMITALHLPLVWRQELLESRTLRDKLEKVLARLMDEVGMARLGMELESKLGERVQRQNREAMLREQLRAIQEELGQGKADGLVERLEAKLNGGLMPDEAEGEGRRELERLRQLSPGSPEHGMVHQYLEWLDRMPWGTFTEKVPTLPEARKILDDGHAGLERVKDRLLEYLAVKRLRLERNLPLDDVRAREPILCVVGPPGVGKTSLGRSVARALGRAFVRVSLGGVHDESAIRGHRRSYVGALPGRIVQALARSGTSDPLILLDEVDKLGIGPHGDPASALLELLDPEQNHAFKDHYLDVPLDLSRVIFMATANTLDGVPPALRDRLEVLSLAGYSEDEKVEIARRHLLPRQLVAHGLAAAEVVLDEAMLHHLIAQHTREAGVRDLERAIATLCRKAARTLAEGGTCFEPTREDVRRHLGPPVHPREAVERVDRAGIATGLVWTPVGGDILFVEAVALPGKKGLKLTGQLGDVMRESAEAALSYVRGRAERYGLDPASFEKLDLHVHVPGGAIPKDGPSAGITLATALLSALTGRLVRDDVAMTGEISLRGKVLPVGGIKEKVLGAHRAGIRTVILPRANLADLEELPPEVRTALRFVPVEAVDEVWDAALLPPRHGRRAA